jgi:hypothetical protein
VAEAINWMDPGAISNMLGGDPFLKYSTLGNLGNATAPPITPAPIAPIGKMSTGTMLQTALGGLQTLGSLWAAWQSMKMAKKQFSFNKEFANANLGNQIKSYNTALADRANSRAVQENKTPESAQAYIAANSLEQKRI